MLALHAAWTADDELALWAEDSDRLAEPAPRGRKKRGPAAHPFAADPAALADVVDAMRAGLDCVEQPIALMLPSTATAPAPSPQLWSAEAAPAVELRSWAVGSVTLSTREGLDLLLATEAAPVGVVLGDSVRWSAQLARFALELCARGQLLPALVRAGPAWEARWRPWIGDPVDASRRATLVKGLPPVLRALAPEVGAAELVDRVLAALVDGCVADALGGAPLGPESPNLGSAEAAWLRALTSDDPELPVGTPGLEALAARIAAWSGPPARADAFRTCFRVVAPEEGDDWRLEYLLQAVDDPSVLVPAADVWRSRGARFDAAGRTMADAQEKLLADLGRAARVAPIVRSSLKAALPSGLDLDADDAWAFLRQAAPLLAQSGFGVLAPTWWSRAGARLGVRMRAAPKEAAIAGGGFGLDALCDVRWEVALGDEALPVEEIERLARLKAPLVRLRGQWVELRPEDVEAALAFYRKKGVDTATTRDVLRAGLGLDAAGGSLPVVGLVATGWLGELLSGASEARFAAARAPEGFGATLRPYQERGLGWLLFLEGLGLGACLADDMGLGKTVQVLALLAHERQGGERPRPTLLVCPMSLVGNWQREAARFTPDLRVVVHHGGDRAQGGFAEAVAGADLVLTTYALAARDADRIAEVEWGRVVLDEAQNIKNAATRQAKAALAIRAPKRIALTGTPVENRLSELWSILEFLNAGLLGTANAFRTRFAVPIERYGDDAAAARLKRVTAPFVLRRLKTDKAIIQDLPDKIEMKIACNLTREQATLYQAVVDEMLARLADLDGEARRGAVLAAMTKLKQVCDHPALLLQDRSALPARSGKLARLEEILDEVVANGEKALVFTQFTEMGHPLKEHLQLRLGREVLFLHGGTSRAGRDEMVRRFSEASGPPVFLLSLKAGGTGLNLVAANHVVHFDRWWNPAVEDQATDRAFRIGQQRAVQVRKLVCAGTLEERIDAMIEGKRALAGKVVGTGEGWLSDLSTQALRDLVALDPDAIGEE